jgi:hypothetical protein
MQCLSFLCLINAQPCVCAGLYGAPATKLIVSNWLPTGQTRRESLWDMFKWMQMDAFSAYRWCWASLHSWQVRYRSTIRQNSHSCCTKIRVIEGYTVLRVCVAVSVNRIEGLKPNVCVQCMGKWRRCHLLIFGVKCQYAGDKQLQQGCAMCEKAS